MRNKALLIFALLVIGFQSCKKKENVDPCVEKFVGEWNCNFISGGCNGSATMRIEPGTDGGCQVLFPNLPFYCGSSSNHVLGTVAGDSVFISSQPFGLTSISGHGSVYLNQITLKATTTDGTTSTISGTK